MKSPIFQQHPANGFIQSNFTHRLAVIYSVQSQVCQVSRLKIQTRTQTQRNVLPVLPTIKIALVVGSRKTQQCLHPHC